MHNESRALSERILYLNSAYLELLKMVLKYLQGPDKDSSWHDLKQWRDEKRLLIESLQVLISRLREKDGVEVAANMGGSK